MRRGGFTIVELLLALLVISLLAAMAIPAFFRHPAVTLESAAVLLAQDLRAAQNRAAYMAEASTFEFAENGDGYRVLDADGDVITNPFTALDFVRRYSEDGVFAGVHITRIEAGSDRSIVYDDHGHTDEAIRVTLAFEGDTRVVEVDRDGGRITIVGSTSAWSDNGY